MKSLHYINRELLWLVLSCFLLLGGIGVLAYGKANSTYVPTPENTRLVRVKEGSNYYMPAQVYSVGLWMIGIGMVATMLTAWAWGVKVDTLRQREANGE